MDDFELISQYDPSDAQESVPHSIEAEKSVLGSILLDGTKIETVAEKIRPEDFYLPQHQDIYKTMYAMMMRGEPIDMTTLIGSLDKAGITKNVGGSTYIAELAMYTPTAANVAYYVNIIEERSMLRRLIKAGSSIVDEARDGSKPLDEILNNAERRIYDISMKNSSETLLPISDVVHDSYLAIGDKMRLKGRLTGTATGFRDLDRVTSGLQKSDLIIVAGRPAMGKTAFVLNIASNVAFNEKKTVAIFSLEMSREQLVTRIMCAKAEVSMQSVKTGQIGEQELIKLSDELENLSEGKIYIDDTAGVSAVDIRSKCRRFKAQHGLDLIIIDYLQLMQSTKKTDSRTQEVSDITRALKILARELNVPIILLSQLSRAPEQRKDHTPIMADLRESGSIEQDADIIIMLYRPAVYGETTENTTKVILAKHRNGPTGTVNLAWIGEYTKFMDAAEEELGWESN